MKKLITIAAASLVGFALSLSVANAADPNTIGEDGFWTQPSHGDEVQQVESVTVTFTVKEALYDSPSLKETRYSIAPQTVKVVAMVQGAFQIKTWLGLKWISPKGKIIYNLAPTAQTIVLRSNTPIYAFPNVHEHQDGELVPQTVTAFETAAGGWFHIRTETGDEWINPSIAEPLDVVEENGSIEPIMGEFVYQYPNKNAKQTASVFGLVGYDKKTDDGWYHIGAADGDGWFQTTANNLPETIDEEIVLRKVTTITSNPVNGKWLGALGPQTVQAFEKWRNYYKIHTWKGDAWVYVEPIDNADGKR